MTKIIDMEKKLTVHCSVCWIAATIVASQIANSQENDLSEWNHYGGSQAGMQYSSLNQITKDNVADLVLLPHF